MRANDIPGISPHADWGAGMIEKGLRGGRDYKEPCESALRIAENVISYPFLLDTVWEMARVRGAAKKSVAALILWIARGRQVSDAKDGVRAGARVEISSEELIHITREIEKKIYEELRNMVRHKEIEGGIMPEMLDKTKSVFIMRSADEDIYDYYQTQGFFFSREILTRFFLSLKTKPFVILTGISGTGKTKIAQIFAEYMCQDDTPEEKEKRIAFVPVRPDWMDNKGLLGYYNLLDEKYHATPLLRLLLEAEEHPEKPYFVILDEMNLAKVEQYFSDFLSIMESRTANNPQGMSLELHAVIDAETPDRRFVPQWFRIPPNVFFTGTVNVDESTYMFSPKVLDRANVIEFNEVNLKNYEKSVAGSDNFHLKNPDVRKHLLPVDGDNPFCSKNDFTEALKIDEGIGECLDKILEILRPFNLHFGYRVINEIARFTRHANELIQDFKLEEVMDIQILQKILPKFHGTQGKLEEPLGTLLAFCYAENSGLDDSYLEKAAAYDKDARFPRAAQKLARMIQNLKVQGYTSFIE